MPGEDLQRMMKSHPPFKMIDISEKPPLHREATAEGEIRLGPRTIRLIKTGRVEKGNPIVIATIAGVAGAKLTPSLMPLCHPLQIESIKIQPTVTKDGVRVKATVKSTGKTGVEMEALTAVSAALLNIWDVVKMYEKDEKGQYPTTLIANIRVVRKVKEGAKREE